jgi:predicted N-acyltransferase
VARRHRTLAGIFPLWLNISRKEAGFPDDYSDHPDIIVADDDMEAITGLLSTALQDASDYSQLLLKHIKPDSNCVRAAQKLGLCPDVNQVFAPESSMPYAVLDLKCGYEEYLRKLGRKFRLNLNRMRSKAQQNDVVVRELSPKDLSPESLPELFLALHESRFGQNTSLKTVCKSPAPWIHHLFPYLFAERRMRVFAVLQKGRIAGLDLTMVTGSGLYGFNGGFVPEIACYDPGKLLIDKTIQQCCMEGLSEYDIGWFGQKYKAHWKPVIRYISGLVFETRSSVVM